MKEKMITAKEAYDESLKYKPTIERHLKQILMRIKIASRHGHQGILYSCKLHPDDEVDLRNLGYAISKMGCATKISWDKPKSQDVGDDIHN